MEPASRIQEHYGSSALVDRIIGALTAAGCDTSRLSPEMLYPVDQLHTGGLNSTKAQAELAGVTKGMRVLTPDAASAAERGSSPTRSGVVSMRST